MRVRARATRRISPVQNRCARCRPDGEWLEHRTLLAANPLGSAVPLQFGMLEDASQSHFLSSPGEVDLYSVALRSGDTMSASINAQSSGSTLTSLLRVFSSSGTPLALDNQEGGDPQLTFQAATAGTYYLGVSSSHDNNYNPLVSGSGTPGGSTGVYTLDVRRTGGPLMPDLTGSSFRTGLDTAAPGEKVPVSFMVQNRGGADPGNFQVQVLLSQNNLFDSSAQVLWTFTRSQLIADTTGRSFSSPEGFTVTVPAGAAPGTADLGLRIVTDPAVPEAGLFDKSGVHRGSDWEFLTVVKANAAGSADLSAIDAALYTKTQGTLTIMNPVSTYSFTVSSALGAGELRAEVSPTSDALLPRLSLSGAAGQLLIQSDSGQIVQLLEPGTYLLSVSGAAGAGSYRLTTAFTSSTLPFSPLVGGSGTAWVASGDLNADGISDVVLANRVDDTASVFLGIGDGIFLPAKTYAIGQRVWRVTVADANGDGRLDILTANKGANTISILLNKGDGTFLPQIVIPVGTRPGGVTVADVNGDGKPDVIVSNYADSTMGVMLGEGNATFGPPQIYSTTNGPGFAGPGPPVVADVNGDGIPDLIYPNYVGTNVAVRLGEGDGTFGPQAVFPAGVGAYSLKVVDVNGDGKLDLVVANAVDNTVSVLLGNGNDSFQPQKVYPVGFDPFAIAVADFNGDGIPDAVTANRGDNTLSVLLGVGDGAFGPQQAYPSGDTPRGVAAADINGDGHVDIINTNQGDNTATVLVGNGDGTFSVGAEQSAPASNLRPFQVVVADLNGDGIPDIVTANRSDNSVSVLLGNRDGSFQTKETFTAGRLPISVAVADLNGDGIPDLVTANYTGSDVSVLLGNGDGTFQAHRELPAGNACYDVKVADLNGDGIPDMVVTNKDDNTVGVFLGEGKASFQPMKAYPVASGPYEVVVDDLTGTGIPDLVVSHFSATVVDVLVGNGDGTFRIARRFPVASRPYGLAVADLNGDGAPDIVTSNYRDDEVSVLLGEGNGSFGPPRTYPVGSGPNEVQVADLNGDGSPDIVTANYGSNTVSVLLGNASGTFGIAQAFAAGSGPASVAVADLNDDGKPDVVVGNRNASTVTILPGKGNGTFKAAVTLGAGASRYNAAVADVNGDGSLDVVTTSLLTNTVTVRLGNGDGTFGPGHAVLVGPAPTRIAVADLNGDGRLDFVTTNSAGNSVSVVLGNGDGTFSAQQSFAVGRSPRAVAVADLSGDGIPDLVVANYNDDTVGVLLGKGDGTFLPQEVFPVGDKPYSVTLADLSGDGRDDIVVANSANDTVSVLFNQGGTKKYVGFAAQITLATGRQPFAVAVADLFGDGKLDVITANASDNTISVFRGNGNGTFLPRQTFAVGSRPYSVAAVDLTGDGALDIVTANYRGDNVSVLLNQNDHSFSSQETFATDLAPVESVVADLNGDGRPDLIVPSNHDSAIGVLLGKGAGAFAPAPAGSGVGLSDTPFLADFNADGINDSIILDRSGEILYRAGIAGVAGTFAPPVVLNPGRPARAIAVLKIGSQYAIAAADAHFDPTLSADHFLFTVSIYTVSATGRLARRTAFATTALPTSLVAAQLTANGLDDLIAANSLDNSVTISLQTSTGGFAAPMTVPAGVAPSDIALADLSGGALPDIVVTDQSSGDVTVLLNTPAHTFSQTLRFRAGTGLYGLDVSSGTTTVSSFAQTVSLVAGNFTGSGGDDIVVVNQDSHSFTLLPGNGNGGFANPAFALTTSTSDGLGINERPGAIVAGDFNRDGNLDLALLMEDTGAVWIYAGNGNGAFRHTFSIPVGDEATGLAVLPGSAPGLLNLLVGNGFGDVLVLQGKGDGTFQIEGSRVSLSVVPNLLGPGQAGVLVGNQENNRVTIQAPSGNGAKYVPVQTLGAASSSAEALAPGDVQWAYLDKGTTLPDAIVVSTGSNAVVVYRTLSVNSGVPTFAPSPETYFVGTAPVGLTVADINNDSVPDMLIADQGSNDVSVLFGSYNAQGQWVSVAGPRLKSGGDGPIAVTVQDISGNGIPDLAVFNAGSGTVIELPGVGRGFFDDQQPRTLINFGSALVQPPTFAGTSGLGYVVTAGGDLARFSLSTAGAGASVVYSGQHVVAAQAVASGQVVVALAGGGVDLLQPRGNTLTVESVLEAQGGVPNLPSAIDVVNEPGGQLNVLVSSQGSDNIFVFAQVAAPAEGEGGGVLPPSSSPGVFNSIQTPTLASLTTGATSALTTSAIATSASATTASASTLSSTSSASVSSTATSSVGLSLGGFSSLGNSSASGSGGTVLVPVEGNTYLSVPILDLGSGNNDDNAAGERRMPELSSKFNFGDTSAVTRFVIGLDEALRGYRGVDESPGFSSSGPLRDPWHEDLFHQHLPILPSTTGTIDDPQAMLRDSQPYVSSVSARLAVKGRIRRGDPPTRPATPTGAGFMALAGVIVAMRRTRARSRPNRPLDGLRCDAF
jgi:FG-GAP-like repeat/Bacterial pre-peptidase C-terminal domain